MNLPQFFCLKGFGYLENIAYDENQCIAKITVIQPFNQESLLLECEIKGILEEYLLSLLGEVKRGNSVIISFSAAYQKFGTSFCAFGPRQEASDERLVILGCKLLSVENCYINEIAVDKNDFKHLLAA